MNQKKIKESMIIKILIEIKSELDKKIKILMI